MDLTIIWWDLFLVWLIFLLLLCHVLKGHLTFFVIRLLPVPVLSHQFHQLSDVVIVPRVEVLVVRVGAQEAPIVPPLPVDCHLQPFVVFEDTRPPGRHGVSPFLQPFLDVQLLALFDLTSRLLREDDPQPASALLRPAAFYRHLSV